MVLSLRRLSLAVVVLLLSGSSHAAPPPTGAKYPSETWLGMYLGESKLGYTVIRAEKTGFRGAPSIKNESVARTEMTLLGTKMSQNIRTTVYSDLSSRPIYQEFKMSSGGKTTEVFAEFGEKAVACRMVTGAGETKKTVPIPPNAKLVGDSYSPVEGEGLKPGAAFTQYTFNPLTLTIDKLQITVDRIQKMKLDGKDVDALVVTSKTPMADLTTYQTVNGSEIIKIDAPMGIEMRRESREQAMEGISGGYQPPKDLAVATSVPAGRQLPSGDLTELRITLSGLPGRSFIISDERQKAEKVKGGEAQTVTFDIRSEEYPASRSSNLPVYAGGALATYLASGPYVESGSDAIKRQAKRIVGDEKNIYEAACRIRRWVNEEMTPQGNMGILRPATDVLQNRTGVCRDYAVLYAALARASGIPTRIIGGLILIRGRFFYHAWDEVWTGNAWVPFDATLQTDRVDASHIKLTEGDATEMFKMGKVIGQLDAQILDFKYQPLAGALSSQ